MKIFHTADHHLSIKKGKETIPYSFENNIIEFNKFSDNLFKKFENLVEKAIKENIDIFISA
jgi:DNA repair exonuclease SbcCD nuclease subunit